MRFIENLHRRRALAAKAWAARVFVHAVARVPQTWTPVLRKTRSLIQSSSSLRPDATLPEMLAARIWRSYTATAAACHASRGLFGRFWSIDGARNRSGRLARVRASASARRQAATLAWAPDSRTSGIGWPANS